MPRLNRRTGARAALVVAVVALLVALVGAPAQARQSSPGATTLALDPGAVAALTGLGVAPAPIAPAVANPDGTLAFPIVSSLGETLRTGTIRHDGGIALTAGATTVALERFWIDPLRRQLTAEVGGARVPILQLGFGSSRIRIGFGGISLGPVEGRLTDVAAQALDSAFGLPAGTIPPGLKLGDATVRYRSFFLVFSVPRIWR